MKPTVGRIVHYQASVGNGFTPDIPLCCAAIVLDVDYQPVYHQETGVAIEGRGPTVTLQIFRPGNPQGWQRSCWQDEDEKQLGTWHWPEREQE